MRIAVAEVAQETDTFSPLVAELADFQTYGLLYGDQITARLPGVGPLGGLLDYVAEHEPNATLLPIVRAWGAAGGTISNAAFEHLAGELTAGLRAALPVDAVFLSLHGAAASQADDDVEGAILERVRAVVGPETPIVCPLDHHANITARMTRHATALVGHQTQPHHPPETGRKAAALLFRLLKGEIRPTLRWRKLPMITPQDQFLTSQGPMREWFELARQMEQRPGVLDISPYPMQPWLDVAEGGWSVVAHTDGDPALADACADEMAEKAWQLRERFWEHERVTPADAVSQAVSAAEGLVILSDTGDSVYGGAPGDSTVILRELLRQQVPCLSLVPVIDPAAVQAALAAGVGAELTLDIGGKVDNVYSQPVPVTARVGATSLGVTVCLGDRGVCDLRQTALLEVGQVRIALLGHRSFAINHPILYTHLGLAIEDARLVVVKTASNFQFFQPWRKQLIRVDSPGMTQSDLTAFPWRRIPRPIWPLEPVKDWRD